MRHTILNDREQKTYHIEFFFYPGVVPMHEFRKEDHVPGQTLAQCLFSLSANLPVLLRKFVRKVLDVLFVRHLLFTFSPFLVEFSLFLLSDLFRLRISINTVGLVSLIQLLRVLCFCFGFLLYLGSDQRRGYCWRRLGWLSCICSPAGMSCLECAGGSDGGSPMRSVVVSSQIARPGGPNPRMPPYVLSPPSFAPPERSR